MSAGHALEPVEARDPVALATLRAIHWVLIPALMTVHAVIWYGRAVSSSAAVYGLKLVGAGFLVVFLLRYRPSALVRRSLLPVWVPAVLLFVTGVLTPIGFLSETEPGYYLTDAVGWLATPAYIGAIYFLLRRGYVTLEALFDLLTWATAIVCFGLLVAWFLTGGEKVSIPPDIHLGIAVTLARWLTARGGNRAVHHATVAVILLGVAASAFRMNYVVTMLTIAAGIGWSLWRQPAPRALLRAVGVAALLGLVVLGFWQQVRGRVESVALAGEVDLAAGQVVADRSAGQRFLEGVLIADEVSQAPLALVAGKGFGATYANTGGLIPHYPARQHNAHSTILVVLLRSGLLGVLIVFSVPFLALRDVVSRERDRFVAGLGMLMTYVALMTDQYLYWSLSFGMAFAMWWFVRTPPARAALPSEH